MTNKCYSNKWMNTHDGINGGGNALPDLDGIGGFGPGRFGIAGAAREVAGGGGGPRFAIC